VGQLARSGHLADPQLVEDLAWLGVPPRVVLRRLVRGQDRQRLDRDLGPEGERLERCDQGVPPEQGREPRDARRDIALVGTRPIVDQQAEIGQRSVEGQVEQLVVRLDRAPLFGRSLIHIS
jgi:hypothetical protein